MKKMILAAAMALGCGLVAFGETWTDAASLDKHAATPEFKNYSPMMRQCGEMKVERFEF